MKYIHKGKKFQFPIFLRTISRTWFQSTRTSLWRQVIAAPAAESCSVTCLLLQSLAMTRLTHSHLLKENHLIFLTRHSLWAMERHNETNAHCIVPPSKGLISLWMMNTEKTLTYPLRGIRFSADQWPVLERQLSTYQRILKFLTVIKTWGFPIEGCSQVCNLLFTNVENAIQGKMWQNDHIFLLM